MTQPATKDYLAYCRIDMGGSWARDKSPEAAIKRCAKLAYLDWKHLFKLKGEIVPIGLFDVTDHDHVYMDDGCVWVEPDDNKRTYLKPLRIEKVKLG